MKKIVTDQVTNVVDIQEVWNYTNVGILWNDTKTKSIIIKTMNENFVALKGSGSLSIENAYAHPTKRDYVRHSINVMKAEAYVFETVKELLTWFAK
jgi:hypothetical protein